MQSYLEAELKAWRALLHRAAIDATLGVYAASIAVMTLYALWYVAGLAAFLSSGTPRPRWRPPALHAPLGPGWPRVAVVYPVYNDYEILASLEKALRMDYPDYFVVVVDDSSDPGLVSELAKLSLREPRLVHLRRPGRRGLKAGALNDAARLAADRGAKYMLVLDADFEPPRWLLRGLVSVAEETGADLVQGHQRHRKGARGVFGRLYRAGMAGAAVFMAGRAVLDMFPIFTGSVGLLRVDAVLETPLREGSISEDLRWSIDRVLDTWGAARFVAVEWAYADGSVPKSLKAYWRQQLRWSSGTLLETLSSLPGFLAAPGIGFWQKAGFLLQGFFFAQGVAVYAATLAPLAYRLLAGAPLAPLWYLGVYIWLTAILAIVLAGAIGEGYRWRDLALVAAAVIPMVYVSGFIHAWGTVRVLLGRGREWVVTPKRGRYEHLYGEE